MDSFIFNYDDMCKNRLYVREKVNKYFSMNQNSGSLFSQLILGVGIQISNVVSAVTHL